MEPRIENTSKSIEVINQWYKSAVATAIIGGVFSVVIVALIVANYFQSWMVNAKREKQLETLKVEIRSQPDTPDYSVRGQAQQLIERIRQLDLQIRRCRIRGLDFSRKGGYLLVGSVAVLLIGVRWAGTIKKKLPSPNKNIRGQAPAPYRVRGKLGGLGDRLDAQVCQAVCARWAITTSITVLLLAALFLALRPAIDFGQIAVTSDFYPKPSDIIKNWPRFRGPGGLGVSAYTNVPVSWDPKTGEGILWKSKVPLPGHNSPVVWNDRIFLSGADANECEVYCFDALSGKLLWTGPVVSVVQGGAKRPLELSESGAGYASPTVVTDGRRVCAIFATGDVGCFDLQGKNLWTRNLGTPDSAYGYASSLEIYRNLLLIQYDQGIAEDQKSKLMALNVSSGVTIWETKRPVPNSWASPIVAKIGERYQVITCGDPWVIAYDPSNGAELWRAKCIGGEVAPSPIYTGGLIFAIEPYTKLVAIQPDGQGDVTKTHIAWSIKDNTPDICCPVSNGELVFLLTSEGTLFCYKLADGTKLWERELNENFRASPSMVGSRLYLLSEKGIMFILEVGTECKEVARCELGEECNASPAFADGRIYIRGLQSLYCIGKGASGRP
jgi:outer membrane protein assembly factor BamB